MKWFKHETDAHNNLKLQSVLDKYGLEAYGYYWACVELVGLQSENFTLEAEKNWKNYLKKYVCIEIDVQDKYLEYFGEINLIDKKALKNVILYIPKMAERSDDYTKRVRRVFGQATDNVHLEEKRIDKKRREKTDTPPKILLPENGMAYLKNIPEQDLNEFYKRFDCGKSAIQSKGETLFLYCESKGRTYKNYKSFLLNALKRDFTERKPSVVVIKQPLKTEEDKPRIPIPEDIRNSINDIIKSKRVT